MTHRDVELLAIGGGPANLALAVAIEEMAPAELSGNTLVIEKSKNISWHEGMLLPDARSQVSFLKDLATLRDPQSRFTFVNYLHASGRLNEFINMGDLWPYRIELSDYFAWAAGSLAKVRLECTRECVGVEPVRAADGTVSGWSTRLADGSTIGSRYLSIGIGRDRYIPPVFAALPQRRVIHSTEYRQRIATLPKDRPYRVVVIGAAQSAAEMFDAVQRDLPGCQRTMVMRTIGMKTYENSRFTNELFFPSFVDEFYDATPAAREQIMSEMAITNYNGLEADMLENIYRQQYLDRFAGKGMLRIITLADVTAAREDSDEVVLELTDRKTGSVETIGCDLVLLGTGFVREMPWLVRGLADSLGLDRIEVTRNYRLRLPGETAAACYLQGVNEATHGIADSLLSVIAPRAKDIVEDLLAFKDENAHSQTGQGSLRAGEQLLAASASMA